MARPEQFAEAYGYTEGQPGVAAVGQSADVIVPIVMRRFAPRRVIDLGCGVGDWLQAFAAHGATDVKGYDGPWVPRSALRIPPSAFTAIDFHAELPAVERCDLAMCLEVAEHVEAATAVRCAEFLCRASDVVLFSAAIPGQGGHGHINEQYQDRWIALFASLGYGAFDLIRPSIWMDARVSWWYQQNVLVFANAAAQARFALEPQPFMASIVHPALYEKNTDPRNYPIREIVKHLPHYVGSRLGLKTP
jgi:hypothetical protein